MQQVTTEKDKLNYPSRDLGDGYSRKKRQLPRPFLRAASAQWRAGSGEQAGVFLSFSYLKCTGVLVFCCVCFF